VAANTFASHMHNKRAPQRLFGPYPNSSQLSGHGGYQRRVDVRTDKDYRVSVPPFAIRTCCPSSSQRPMHRRVALLACPQIRAHDSLHMHPIIDELTRDSTEPIRSSGSRRRTDYPIMRPRPVTLCGEQAGQNRLRCTASECLHVACAASFV
jgi:hypothetical protein